MAPRLFIIIPCYNEEAVLPVTAPMFLEKIKSLIAAEKISENSRISRRPPVLASRSIPEIFLCLHCGARSLFEARNEWWKENSLRLLRSFAVNIQAS